MRGSSGTTLLISVVWRKGFYVTQLSWFFPWGCVYLCKAPSFLSPKLIWWLRQINFIFSTMQFLSNPYQPWILHIRQFSSEFRYFGRHFVKCSVQQVAHAMSLLPNIPCSALHHKDTSAFQAFADCCLPALNIVSSPFLQLKEQIACHALPHRKSCILGFVPERTPPSTHFSIWQSHSQWCCITSHGEI